MRLFEVQSNLTSYTYPLIKITICISVIFLCIIRNQLFHLSIPLVNVIVTAFCFVLTIVSILCLYISIGEIFHIHTNRRKVNYQPLDIKLLTIETVTKIASENDIIEIELYTDNRIIEIGASSECEYSSSVFKNKLYYISNSKYDTIELFTNELHKLFPEGYIPVWRIDGQSIWGRDSTGDG